ncbi:DNA adenine methylase [Natronorubrum thiooxidans]|uniref:site-specific DNA-methyltransferase (adenine-specific) n=1 Tax=Natronorubrum thiooxidans TaxID=308853 RepID=A0A1N7GUI2_9EURY|nr:Dam family site-specific DNA-(adenine-N6)-methyltransferase [Natronorubrum thiooxidans]SIS16243.1 DNA adenine methylase [Natronorubrum thiooxidans]
MAEPILSWAGGKRHLLDDILRRLPPKNRFDTYYEPFFGGGAVFFSLEPANGYINDINSRLMNFYRQVRDYPERIIEENREFDHELENLVQEEQKEIYYEYRNEFNSLRTDSGECRDQFREAVLMLFLNRTCWNSLYRTNRDGEFNVPMGSKWTRISNIEGQIRKGYQVLKNTTITSKDFNYVGKHADENDLVFFDPPYPEESKTAQFNQYDPSGFGEEEQIELRELALELNRRGTDVLITNGPSAEKFYVEHEDFYEEFRITTINGERRINSDETQRTNIGATDIIVSNFDPFIEQRTFDDYR